MPEIVLPPVSPYRGLRSVDAYGSGGYGAPRLRDGERYGHKGQDFLGKPGDIAIAPITGYIVHLGLAYPDSDLGSIHIVGEKGSEFEALKVKLLYIARWQVATDNAVHAGETIGYVQDVAGYHAKHNPAKSARMQNHVHLELYFHNELVDPGRWLALPADPEVPA